jgi:hypothetical protein
MWCTNCQQDVPAIAHGDLARCAQCGRFLKRRADDHSADAASPVTANETESVFAAASIIDVANPDDDWTLEQRLRHLQRRLRLDEAITILPPVPPNEFRGAVAELPRSYSSPGRPPILAWITIVLGAMTFVAGAVLFAFALALRRNEFWNFGLPLTLCGQFALLLGLTLQLKNLRQSNRRATELLESLDHRLHQMGAVSTPFTHPSHSPATRFSHS